jgi:Ala-tRNA(Pro) deacylase
MKYLGLTPGSVSPFGLVNDPDRHVRVYLDRDLKSASRISFHPNINTATVVIRFADFERFLAASGHQVRYVDVTRGAPENASPGRTT